MIDGQNKFENNWSFHVLYNHKEQTCMHFLLCTLYVCPNMEVHRKEIQQFWTNQDIIVRYQEDIDYVMAPFVLT